MVCLYHDTIPKPDYAPTWPESIPGVGDYDNLDRLIEEGWLLCGNPEEVAGQLERYQEVGCDQVVFGLPSDSMEHDEVLEMLEVFGTKVIPEFDKDEVHSTTRYRATAKRKYPDFALRRARHRRARACRPTPSSSWTAPASSSQDPVPPWGHLPHHGAVDRVPTQVTRCGVTPGRPPCRPLRPGGPNRTRSSR